MRESNDLAMRLKFYSVEIISLFVIYFFSVDDEIRGLRFFDACNLNYALHFEKPIWLRAFRKSVFSVIIQKHFAHNFHKQTNFSSIHCCLDSTRRYVLSDIISDSNAAGGSKDAFKIFGLLYFQRAERTHSLLCRSGGDKNSGIFTINRSQFWRVHDQCGISSPDFGLFLDQQLTLSAYLDFFSVTTFHPHISFFSSFFNSKQERK